MLDPSILSRVDAIVQQSNCVGCDGRGLAAAIAEKLPYGDTYKDRRPMPPARKFAIPEDRAVPGSIAVRRGSGPAVVSLFAQFGQWISVARTSNEIALHAIDATLTHCSISTQKWAPR